MAAKDHDHASQSATEMEMMPMFFTIANPAHILFQPWSPKTTGEMIGACFAIFFMACLFEGLKRVRQHLYLMESNCHKVVTTCCDTGTTVTTETIIINPAASSRVTLLVRTVFHRYHLLQTLLQGVQFTLGYLLMLAAMTFNVYLFISMILGTMFGYFVFQWNPAAPAYVSLQEDHCH